MCVLLFIDGPALVCEWVNFPILWPHTHPRTNEVEVPPRGIQELLKFFVKWDRVE